VGVDSHGRKKSYLAYLKSISQAVLELAVLFPVLLDGPGDYKRVYIWNGAQ
jgi:hypothetical protein